MRVMERLLMEYMIYSTGTERGAILNVEQNQVKWDEKFPKYQ